MAPQWDNYSLYEILYNFLGILQEDCGGFLVGDQESLLRMLAPRSLAVRTKPSSVLAGRKLLMRLDGVCADIT